jgi:macrolide-specific efflux system membrane fusion protein
VKLRDYLVGHKRAVIVAALLLAAGGGAYYYYVRGARDAAPSYRAVPVARGDISASVLSTGVVQPRNRLEIKVPIPGRVEQVLVEEGQWVTKGAVLAWMSSTERAALLDAARARGPDEVKRWEELYRATPILAPIDGTLILRNVEPGQSFISTDAVFVMSDRLIVVAQVDETDIGQVKLKQAARIELDAYPGQAFDGRVEQIAYDAKTVNNVTTYAVDVLPQKVPGFMRSGMTANVSFQTATRRNVLLVPSEALQSRDGRSVVLRPGEGKNGAPREQPVETGVSDGRHTEVTAGVAEGETLLAPRLKLTKRNGQAGTNPFMPGRKRN